MAAVYLVVGKKENHLFDKRKDAKKFAKDRDIFRFGNLADVLFGMHGVKLKDSKPCQKL